MTKPLLTCKIDLESTQGEFLLNSLRKSCNKNKHLVSKVMEDYFLVNVTNFPKEYNQD